MTKKPMKLPPRNAMVQLTDPDTGKARKMKPLGQAARRIYRKQILAGTDPAFVLPRELRWQPDDSGGGGAHSAETHGLRRMAERRGAARPERRRRLADLSLAVRSLRSGVRHATLRL